MKGRPLTWVLVAALGGIGLVAAVDAIRTDEGRGQRVSAGTSEAATPTVDAQLTARLREAGVTGVITYSDASCGLHAVTLPDLRPARAPGIESCEPYIPTGGIGAFEGDVVWSGLGFQTVEIVLSQEELGRAIRPALGLPAAAGAFRAVQAVTLGERRVVLADSTYEPRERVLAAFDGRRRRFVHPRWVVGDAGRIRPSPGGRYYALLGSDLTGIRLFTRDGRQLLTPQPLPRVHAVAWSPDDAWTALATASGLHVFPSERPNGPVIRIPLAVQDLDWGA
jgi:hypothetical protein